MRLLCCTLLDAQPALDNTTMPPPPRRKAFLLWLEEKLTKQHCRLQVSVKITLP